MNFFTESNWFVHSGYAVILQSDTAYSYIRAKIDSSEYPPGFFISTKKLATQIGVSRTPIRDAIRRLEQEGLVTVTPRYGAQVTSLSLRQFVELWQLRVAFEGMAARLAALCRTDDDIALLEVNLTNAKQIAKSGSGSAASEKSGVEFATNDRSFHLLIVQASQNLLLKQEVSRLQTVNLTIGRSVREGEDLKSILKPPFETYHEHEAIVEAIKKKSPDRARNLMEMHLNAKDLEATYRAFGHSGPA